MTTYDMLPTGLQESLLALLAFNDDFGSSVAAQVTPDLFDEPYQEIAVKLLTYRRQYGKAPGKVQLDDLFGWALEKGETAPRLRRLVAGLVDLYDGINPEFVANRVHEFVRRQTIKAGIKSASEIYHASADSPDLDEIENVLNTALRRSRVSEFDTGVYLSEPETALRYLDGGYNTGIPIGVNELDEIPIVCAPKELLLYIGSKGSGKTWFGIHMGRQGLLCGAAVLHITLEVQLPILQNRYYQCLFGIARWQGKKYKQTSLILDEFGNLTDIRGEWVLPQYALNDAAGSRYMQSRVKQWKLRLGRIKLKEFPTRSLTLSKLIAYLDYLENTEKFTPDLVIIDYPDLMKMETAGDFRVNLGRMYEDLRGLAVTRNFALVAPTQGNRSSLKATTVRADMVAEDITKINTADIVLTYSQSESEKRFNSARIHVAHARNSEGGQTIVISQAYMIGQWCNESAILTKAYLTRIRHTVDDDE